MFRTFRWNNDSCGPFLTVLHKTVFVLGEGWEGGGVRVRKRVVLSSFKRNYFFVQTLIDRVHPSIEF